MEITLHVPDSFKQLPLQAQEQIREWTEKRLAMELDLAQAEKEGRYDSENLKLIRVAIQQASDAIAQGISREKSFKTFREAQKKVSYHLRGQDSSTSDSK